MPKIKTLGTVVGRPSTSVCCSFKTEISPKLICLHELFSFFGGLITISELMIMNIMKQKIFHNSFHIISVKEKLHITNCNIKEYLHVRTIR
jgi:hypothetical protein